MWRRCGGGAVAVWRQDEVRSSQKKLEQTTTPETTEIPLNSRERGVSIQPPQTLPLEKIPSSPLPPSKKGLMGDENEHGQSTTVISQTSEIVISHVRISHRVVVNSYKGREVQSRVHDADGGLLVFLHRTRSLF